jgi:hypothetical protein
MQAVTSIINLSGTDVTIKMFPNPVTDQLTLEATSNIEKYEVYTFSGSLYETKNVNLLSTQIDVMSYPVGTFLMKIYTQYGTISNKLIIQK